MNVYLDQKTMIKLEQRLVELKNTDLTSPRYALLKTSNKWLAKAFDEEINNFYDKKVEEEVLKIPLTANMEKEIYLFNWIKVNGYNGLKENYASTQDFLFSVSSPFYERLNYYRFELNKKNNNPNMLFRDFITVWESILIKRIADYRFSKIEEMRSKFLQDMYNRIEIYHQANGLLKTVWNFFGVLWDPQEHLTKSLGMEAIDKFAKFLENNPAIMEIATLLGRYQGESKLIEQRILEEIVMDFEWKPVGSSPEEIIGATESKDLEHMFPAELVLLRDPLLKYIFYKKYIEGKLTTFEFLSQDKVPKEQIKLTTVETRVPEEKGPIILSIDTSSSMRGSPEQIAKALALAICKIALQERRPCYMINFAKTLDVYDFSTVKNSIPNLIKFLSKSFNGDTDIEPALVQTLKVMDENEYFNADLLMISDFMTPPLTDEMIEQIGKLKNRRNRFHAIAIGTMGDEATEANFDNTWVYDPRDPFASERIIASLTEEFNSSIDKIPEAKNILQQVKEGKGKVNNAS